MFRQVRRGGALVFERHIEGAELDDYMRNRPTAWPRRKTATVSCRSSAPIVTGRRGRCRSGNLWISLDVPFTYVYDRRGDKRRVVQLRAAGAIRRTTCRSRQKAGCW